MPRALILAAGEGRRFGGPKQLAELDGKPLLQHVLETAAPWDPLVVLGAHADEILLATFRQRGAWDRLKEHATHAVWRVL